MVLNEKEFKLFKKWLKGHLAFGPVTVVFTKKDGTERVMECTTATSLVPIVESTEPKREKKVNDDVIPVYDLENKAWKSFRWDSIKQVRLEIK
ncbi:MAG: Enterobacter phage [Bacteroidota bacterium]|jgi:hypothetical protein